MQYWIFTYACWKGNFEMDKRKESDQVTANNVMSDFARGPMVGANQVLTHCEFTIQVCKYCTGYFVTTKDQVPVGLRLFTQIINRYMVIG